MKKVVLLLIILYSCSTESYKKTINEDKKYSQMLDSCNYNIVINNKEQMVIYNYEFINNGCVRIIYPKKTWENIAKWDTAIIGGNFGITKIY